MCKKIWLKLKAYSSDRFEEVAQIIIKELQLHTFCEEEIGFKYITSAPFIKKFLSCK